MAYIPARRIVADDPLAYFSALNAPKNPPVLPQDAKLVGPTPADRAIELMYGYYAAE